MLITIGDKNNHMHPVNCLIDTLGQPNLISKELFPTDWLYNIYKEVQPALLSAQKDLLETKSNTTHHIGFGDLLTALLCTVSENLAIDVLLDTASIDDHILAILPDEQRIAVRKSNPVYFEKQQDTSANAVSTKHNTEVANIKTYLE